MMLIAFITILMIIASTFYITSDEAESMHSPLTVIWSILMIVLIICW